MKNSHPVVMIGAGLAGLTAATYLKRHGVPIRIFEASKNIAGLARSIQDPDGFTYDFGAHFITNRLAAAVGVSAQSRHMPRYGESVFRANQVYSYPFGLMRSPRYWSSALWTKSTNLFRSRPKNAAEWFSQAYGHRLAEEIAIPLTEAWSGAKATELAPSVGEKFTSSLPRVMMLLGASRLTKRTVAVGYSTSVTESPHVWHVYPEGGIGAVCEKLADEVRDCVSLESPVEAIHTENQEVVGVTVNGKDYDASAVVSTAPLHVLPKLVRGTDSLHDLSRIRYRPMIFVNLRLRGRNLLPNVVTWTPESKYPFFRLSEIGMGLPWLVPEGHTLITADIGAQVGDEHWTKNDEQLGELCRDALLDLIPDIHSRYLGCRVLRTPVAYPVYLNEYESRRKEFAESTGIAGLYCIGRNGEFAHILMEDVFWRTRRKMLRLMQERNLI
jgi:protoporphyrinogen oxidase